MNAVARGSLWVMMVGTLKVDIAIADHRGPDCERHVTVFQTNVEVRLTPSNVPLRAADDILRSPMNLQSEEAPMPVDPRHNSRKLLEGPDRVVARAMMKAVGFTDESLARPQIGIAH